MDVDTVRIGSRTTEGMMRALELGLHMETHATVHSTWIRQDEFVIPQYSVRPPNMVFLAALLVLMAFVMVVLCVFFVS